MIVFNSNNNTDKLYILPLINISAGVDEISGYTLELVDDETKKKYDFVPDSGFWQVEGDFLTILVDNSTNILKDEKYYTMRVKRNVDQYVVYRDKLFVTKQINNVKYDNNKDQYVPADTGNNDYIIL